MALSRKPIYPCTQYTVHTSSFLTYCFRQFVLYAVVVVCVGVRGAKGAVYCWPPKCKSRKYICGTFYYTVIVFKAHIILLWAPHHGCTWAPLVLHTVYSACVSQSVKCETLNKVFMVRSPHLWLSCWHPVLAYTTRCNCFAVKHHFGGSHISSIVRVWTGHFCRATIAASLLRVSR